MSRPIRICDITSFYPNIGSGGVRRYIERKQQYLQKHNLGVHGLIIPEKTYKKDQVNDHSIVYKTGGFRIPWNQPYGMFSSYKDVERALDDFDPDIIEVGSPYVAPWYVFKYIKSRRKPITVIGFYHSDFPRADVYQNVSRLSVSLARFLERICDWYAKKVFRRLLPCIVSTQAMKDRLAKWDCHDVPIFPFGIDVNTFQPYVEPKPPTPGEKLKLLYCGRLDSDKGILPFVQQFQKLMADKDLPLELTIQGRGFLKDQLVKITEKTPYITFGEFVHNAQELSKVYASHHLLVVTNPYESFCIAALESMASGTPVAALSDESGVKSLVPPEVGYLVGKQTKDFMNFLEHLDPADVFSKRKAAREFAATNFDQDKCHRHLFEFYKKIMPQEIEEGPKTRQTGAA